MKRATSSSVFLLALFLSLTLSGASWGRWYSAGTGRFLSEDEIGATQTRLREARELNGFGYAAGNPTRWVDANGLCRRLPDGRIVHCGKDSNTLAGEDFSRSRFLSAQGRPGAALGFRLLGALDNSFGEALGDFQDIVYAPLNSLILAGKDIRNGSPGNAVKHTVRAAQEALNAAVLIDGVSGGGVEAPLPPAEPVLEIAGPTIDMQRNSDGVWQIPNGGGRPQEPALGAALLDSSNTSGPPQIPELSIRPDLQLKAGGPPPRPSWQQSEGYAQTLESMGFSYQASFKDGRDVPYGTLGSTRPDEYSRNYNLAVDEKNYDLQTSKGRASLTRNVLVQSANRTINLPAGTRQGLILDIRGQTVQQKWIDRLINRISIRSNGAINADDIYIESGE